MSMFDPESRRRELLLRGISYFVMSLSVVAVLVIALFYVLGFTIDKKTGEPVQGGLLQFRSYPENATVSVNGRVIADTTPAKLNAEKGSYLLKMQRNQYRDWVKQSTLRPGEVLWLNALLVPSRIKTNEALAFPELAHTMFSPDRKWVVLQEKVTLPTFKIIDLRDEKTPKLIDLPISGDILPNQKPEDTFQITEWDFGARYMLVKRVNDGKISWLRIDRSDPTNSRNISDILGVEVRELHFSGTSGAVFYGTLNDGTLRKLDIASKTISSPIASNVTEFQLYKDNKLVFITKTANEQTVAVYTDGLTKPNVIKKIKDTTATVHAARSEYFQDDFIALSVGRDFELFRYSDETANKVFYKNTFKEVPEWLFFGNSGRFLVFQTGNQLGSYDLERKQAFEFTIPHSTTAYARSTHVEWLDDFHFWSDNGGKLFIFEFDGSNQQEIGNVTPGFDVALSNNGKRLFSFNKNATTTQPILQSSVMVLE